MKKDPNSLSFGRYLQTIRLEKKISLEKVSAQTRIGLSNLILIEQEDIDRLPAEVFVKGFLRSFAGAIGADGDEAVHRFESRLNVVKKIAVSEDSTGRSAPRMWSKLLMSLVLFAGIVGLSIFGVAIFQNRPDTDEHNLQKVPAGTEPAAGTQGKKSGDSDVESDAPVAEKFLLEITALEDTWLKVIIDQKDSSEHTLAAGDKIELEATTGFNLLIGNSGGVKITLNDKPVSLSGKSGEVVTINLP